MSRAEVVWGFEKVAQQAEQGCPISNAFDSRSQMTRRPGTFPNSCARSSHCCINGWE